MSTTPVDHPSPPGAEPRIGVEAPVEARRAYRDTQEPIIGGVAGGLAAHLAIPVLWVRAAFVLATAFGGFVLPHVKWLVTVGQAGDLRLPGRRKWRSKGRTISGRSSHG